MGADMEQKMENLRKSHFLYTYCSSISRIEANMSRKLIKLAGRLYELGTFMENINIDILIVQASHGLRLTGAGN